MTILVIDGQGGRMGCALVEQINALIPGHDIVAVGSNSIATSAMLKAGAHAGATGENPVVVNAPDADVIVGPIGIIIPNALLGEITPKMAQAVSQSAAPKVLLPVNRYNHTVVGVTELPLAEYVRLAIEQIKTHL